MSTFGRDTDRFIEAWPAIKRAISTFAFGGTDGMTRKQLLDKARKADNMRKLTEDEISTITSALGVTTDRYKEWAHSLRGGEFQGLRGSLRLAEQFDRQVSDIEKLQAVLAVGDLLFAPDAEPAAVECEYCGTMHQPPACDRRSASVAEIDAQSGGVCDTCGRSAVEIARTVDGQTVCIYCDKTGNV